MVYKFKSVPFVTSILFLVYVLITVFLGYNVRAFVKLDWEADGVLPGVHYIALPFLLMGSVFCISRIKFRIVEKKFILLSLLLVAYQKFVLQQSAGLSILINSVFEPILLLGVLRILKDKDINRIKNIIILFLFIESLISIYEYLTQNWVFADPSRYVLVAVLQGTEDMRAYALHGHPLQNAFLVGVSLVAILFSEMKIMKRYIVFFISIVAIACFNTRSTMLIVSVMFLISFYRDSKSKKIGLAKKIIFLLFICAVGCIAVRFILLHDMGSRMVMGIGTDGSSMARVVLIQAFSQLNLFDLLFGAASGISNMIMTKYSLIAIENSYANLILAYGLIFAIIFSYFWGKIIFNMSSNKALNIMMIIVVFALLNVNNVIITDCPSMEFVVLVTYCFGKKNCTKKISLSI